MKTLSLILLNLLSFSVFAGKLPSRYIELLPYVQAAPDQGETNTCWFVASTGAMELLLNKKDNIKHPKRNGKYDLSESFLIWQPDYFDEEINPRHFIEEVVIRFNHGEAIHNKDWPFVAYDEEGEDTQVAWNRHPDFEELPRMKVPPLKTTFLFARGKRYATHVLTEEDIITVKKALVEHKAPVIVNYNDDYYWHVILIVGYNDKVRGDCYDMEGEECNKKGSFYVRDSSGRRLERRAYDWFRTKGNAAAVVELK